MSDRICVICGKTNPNHHQDFCVDLGCSGRLKATSDDDRKRHSKRESSKDLEKEGKY